MRIIFDKRSIQSNEKTVTTHLHPVIHDVYQFLSGGSRSGSGNGFFPRMGAVGFSVSVIECRLAIKIVFTVCAVALKLARNKSVGPYGGIISPYITVGIGIRFFLLGICKPRRLIGTVPCYQIEYNFHSSFMSFFEKRPQIIVRTVTRSYSVEINNVIT